MAVPTLALIPAAQGSKLYSVLPSNGVGDFDFTRASTATRINSKGLIEEVASGVSRLDYTGGGCPSHLLEPQRTNNVFYSQEVDNAYWLKSNCAITSNTSISPDGTLNADTLTITSGASGVVYRTGINVGSLSFFAKDINLGTATFTISVDGVGSASWDKNGLLTSYGGGTATNGEYYGNGWYRFVFTVTSGTVVNYGISSGTVTNSILVFGLQNEPSSTFQTSYIPTTSSAVTRLAETANNAGDASTFNDSEGVLYAEISALANDLINRIISLSDGSGSNRVLIKYDNSSDSIQASLTSAGSDQATLSFGKDITINSKIAFKYKLNDFSLWVDGLEVDTDTSGATPVGLSELAFDNGSGGSDFYGNTKQLEYYNTALTSLEIETLTSYTSFNAMALAQNYTI